MPDCPAAHGAEVVASLQCYGAKNDGAQRGGGVFEKSIRALKKLNSLGYGTRLPLGLVYNPLGAKLPPPPPELEADDRTELRARHGIEFTRLFAIANQPIARIAQDRREQGQWDAYLELPANSSTLRPSTSSCAAPR